MRERAGQECPCPVDDVSVAATSKRDTLIKKISNRLRPVCSRMPADEFDAMVQRIADIELKYAGQSTPSHPEDRAD
jgi:hypothetical protein